LASVQLTGLDAVKGGSQLVTGRELHFEAQLLAVFPGRRHQRKGFRWFIASGLVGCCQSWALRFRARRVRRGADANQKERQKQRTRERRFFCGTRGETKEFSFQHKTNPRAFYPKA